MGQKRFASEARGRSDVAWPIAPDMMALSCSELQFSAARCCGIARARAVPRAVV